MTAWLAGDKDDQLSASQLRARHGVQNGTAGGGGDGGMHLGMHRGHGKNNGKTRQKLQVNTNMWWNPTNFCMFLHYVVEQFDIVMYIVKSNPKIVAHPMFSILLARYNVPKEHTPRKHGVSVGFINFRVNK